MSDDMKNRPFTKEEFERELEQSYESNLETETLLQENKQINAKIQNKKLKMQSEEIDRISAIQDSLEDEDLSQRKFNKSRMLKSIEDRKNAVIFLQTGWSFKLFGYPGYFL